MKLKITLITGLLLIPMITLQAVQPGDAGMPRDEMIAVEEEVHLYPNMRLCRPGEAGGGETPIGRRLEGRLEAERLRIQEAEQRAIDRMNYIALFFNSYFGL